LCGPDPENPEVKAFIHTKANLSALAPTLTYTIENGVFRWKGQSDLTADQVLASPANGQERTELDEAKNFLREILCDGPVNVDAVKKDARRAGISEITLRRAKIALGVLSKKASFGSGWCWELPGRRSTTNEDHFRKISHSEAEKTSIKSPKVIIPDEGDHRNDGIGDDHLRADYLRETSETDGWEDLS
jgi:hypothetical protein